MISISREVETSQSDQQMILDSYRRGLSIHKIHAMNPRIPRRKIQQVLHSHEQVRGRGEGVPEDPSPEEIARLALLTKDSWTDEEAASRWVGRAASKYETAGRWLSSLLRD
jgi:hypothetical protein